MKGDTKLVPSGVDSAEISSTGNVRLADGSICDTLGTASERTSGRTTSSSLSDTPSSASDSAGGRTTGRALSDTLSSASDSASG
jgi:hypothetical protein